LIIEEKVIVAEKNPDYKQSATGNRQPETSNQQPANTKLSPLEKIRKQVKGNGNGENGNGQVNRSIVLEELQQAWDEYAAQLKKEKNAAWQNFDMATLQIADQNNFIAIVSNNLQLRFIEQQGLKVSQFLRQKLNNNLIQFLIVMQENKEDKDGKPAPLSAREQYQKMVEQYPLVKELKERLRLELDY